MRYAVATWIAPLIVVEVDPGDFDGTDSVELEKRLSAYFLGASFVLVTPDPRQSSGIRSRGLAVPHNVLTEPDLVWHDLELPEEPDVPF